MEIQLPEPVTNILTTFEKAGYEIYIIGGAVRDLLTGRITYDWDFTTNATPDEILKLFADGFYDNKFGTVGIPSKSGRPYEITTFRTEHGYSDSRRPDKINWGKTLKEDLVRRDFTINAMALKIQKDDTKKKSVYDKTLQNVKIIDYFDGQRDLENKLIKAVGDAQERFAEDALRMMRAIRIASELGFTIEDKTFKAIEKNASLINNISKERIRDELLKTLASAHPYEGIELFRKSNLMKHILPELEKAFGVEQASPGRHHIYDVGKHSMYSLKYVSEKNTDPIVRLATLIHDIGKPKTYKKLKNGTITFYNHEIVSANIAKRVAKRLRFSKRDSERFYKLVRYHQFTVDEKQTDSAIRRFIRKVGLENIPDILDLRVGDRLGGGARETSWRLEEFKKRLIEVQKQPFTVHDLKITGYDVMKQLKLKPGPKVGEVLNQLYRYVVDNKVANKKADLINRLKEIDK